MAQPPDRHEEFIPILNEFMQAESWAASRQVLEKNPVLLSEEMDAFIEASIGRAHEIQEERLAYVLTEYRAFLRRCREVGIEQAYAERMPAQQPETELPPAIEEALYIIQEAKDLFLSTGNAEALDEAVSGWEALLERKEIAELPVDLQAALLSNAGEIYLYSFWARENAQGLEKASELFRQAAELTPEDSPDLAGFLNNLGVTLLDLQMVQSQDDPERGLETLHEAIQHLRKAVAITREEDAELAMYVNNLGVALRDLYRSTEEEPLLQEATSHFRRAVELTPEQDPNLARYINNLGIALGALYTLHGNRALLEEAVSHFRRAVELTPEENPAYERYLHNLREGEAELQELDAENAS